MSKVYDEYQRRLAKGHEMITESGVTDAAIVEAILGVLAREGDRVRFVLNLQTILKAAFEVERQWALDEAEAAPAEAAAVVECGCRACQLRKAAEGGPVVVEYATAEEAAELLARYGEAF